MNELADHLRQAEADLGLARVSVGQALCCADNRHLPYLKMLTTHMELIENTLASIRRAHEHEREQDRNIRPPRSSDR